MIAWSRKRTRSGCVSVTPATATGPSLPPAIGCARAGLGMRPVSRTISGGGLVLAEALERGMAQQPVARPLGERDLGHQLGLHPVRAGRAAAGRGARTASRAARACAAARPGARAWSGRTRCRRARRRRGVRRGRARPRSSEPNSARAPSGSVYPPITSSCRATHFTLSHAAPAPGSIRRARLLRDDALEAQAAGAIEHPLAGSVEVLGVAEAAAAPLEQPGQRALLRSTQRQRPQVASVEKEQVEGHVDEAPPASS